MGTKPRVAICQSDIAPGGRLRVLIGLVEILNEAGIVPDMLTSHLAIDPEEIGAKYGRSIQAHYRGVPTAPRLPQDFRIVLFNATLGRYARAYDLLINSSNSLIFLPKQKKVVSYIHFPRKRRITGDVPDLHRPEAQLKGWSLMWLERAALRQLYRLARAHPGHMIVCNSDFTRVAVEEEYNPPVRPSVIYPPSGIGDLRSSNSDRVRAVVTVGRFAPEKRQLEQIIIAEQLPHMPFHIVGFAGKSGYYRSCERYAEEHQLANVHLHPDADLEEVSALLQRSRYFLHTTVNEPFGITVVEGIAAGCLPVVHDSGGQREIVREDGLRYQSLDEVPDMLERLDALGPSALYGLRRRLQEHVKREFDAAMFHRRMRALLAAYLPLEA